MVRDVLEAAGDVRGLIGRGGEDVVGGNDADAGDREEHEREQERAAMRNEGSGG